MGNVLYGINIAPAHTHTRGFTRNIIPPLIRPVKFFLSTSCVSQAKPHFRTIPATPDSNPFCNSRATIALTRSQSPLLTRFTARHWHGRLDPSTDTIFGSTKNPQFTRREKTPPLKAFNAEKKAAGLRVGSGLRMCAYA